MSMGFMHMSGTCFTHMTTVNLSFSKQYFEMTCKNFIYGRNVAHGSGRIKNQL